MLNYNYNIRTTYGATQGVRVAVAITARKFAALYLNCRVVLLKPLIVLLDRVAMKAGITISWPLFIDVRPYSFPFRNIRHGVTHSFRPIQPTHV